MDDFSVLLSHPVIDRSVVFVTWEDTWPLERYVQSYLRERELPMEEQWALAAIAWLAGYPEDQPFRKSDVDYFLDINAERWAPDAIVAAKAAIPATEPAT